jgi:5-oxoprolinase (ATP-hydrolysing) subunit B
MMNTTPSLHALGEAALLCEWPAPATDEAQARVWAMAEAIRQWPHVREVVPGMNNLCVMFDPLATTARSLAPQLRALWRRMDTDVTVPVAREIEIPVRYGGNDGPDLDAVAAHTGLSADEVVARHSAGLYQVYFVGFQPGFAYLGGLDACLHTPRRAEPRLAVPAGSVGIGGEQTGVYPAASPGGWQLIGRTTLSLFDPARTPPALLEPGDRVRFVELNK